MIELPSGDVSGAPSERPHLSPTKLAAGAVPRATYIRIYILQ
jgi:hypothetical protein